MKGLLRQIRFQVQIGIAALALMALGSGCARSLPSAIPVDSPEHSYSNGVKFMDKGEYENALLEFERAKAKDPKYAPAYIGIALVKAAQEDYQAAFAALDKARSVDGVAVHASAIRVLTAQQGEGWLQSAEREFEAGRLRDPLTPSLYFFMGKAYEEAYSFEKAASMFRRVLALNRGFSDEAIFALRRLERIQKANLSTDVGKKVALLAKVTRGDIATLLVKELKLDTRVPKASKAARASQEFPIATDLAGHPYKAEIETAVELRLRGLGPFPDRTFAPEKPISRADFSILLEDLIVRLKGGRNAQPQSKGFLSPFTDITPDHYAFDAILWLTSEKILEPRPDGRFGPGEFLSGIEAISAISRVKEGSR
ncbi:MAG: S-layer homology domain-containing protein [candidate division NC10 bacterium]|nr:S-layer homology domain-containing protein [candidate division NC10 bacterium]